MLFAEPRRTRFDVRFVLSGISVRIDPWFWVVTIGLALRGVPDLRSLLIWVAAVMFSILVHELGHALTMRRYGARPRIVLYSMGGLAIAESAPASRRQRITVAAAGPLAQLLLAAVVIGLMIANGYRFHVLSFGIGSGDAIEDPLLATVVADLLAINVGWALLNLLPVHPLDGANIASELLATSPPELGVLRSLRLSIATGIAVALLGLVYGRTFFPLMFAYLAFMSWQLVKVRGASPLPPSLRRAGSRIRVWLDRRERKERRKAVERSTAQAVDAQERAEEQPTNEAIEKEGRDLLEQLTREVKRGSQSKGG